jgi:predicted enzyme related to lactoylglutathione lyase
MSHGYGKFLWFEYMSGDSVSASTFYDALFGWRAVDTPMGGPQPYPLIMNGSEGIGGFRAAAPCAAAMWMSYVSVRDVDVSHSAALAAGGSSVIPPTDVPNVGRFATLLDPQRTCIAFMKPVD